MKKNVGSQIIGAQLVNATTGAAFTGSVTAYVTGDGGTQAVGSVGSGACTHEGNGFHTYAPAQAETNFDHIGFTFIGTGAVPATVQVYPHFPQTGDSFARLGATAGASVSADVAAIKAETATILADTNDIQTRLPAALVSGRIDASVGAMAANVLTATAIAADAITDAKVAADVTIASVTGAVGSVTGAVGSVTGNVGGNVTGSVGSVATGGITATSIAADAIGASELAADAVAEISAAVWAEATRTLTAGTNIVLAKGTGVTGFNDLSAAAVNAEVDTAISDAALATAANLATVAGYIDTEVAAILAAVDTEVASIKITTDRLGTTLEGGAGSPGEFRFSADALVNAPAGSGGGSAPSAAAIADAVWDEILSGHAGVGSTGAALSAAGGSGDPWATALPGAYGAGTAGQIVGDYIDAAISSVSGLDAAGVRAAVGLASANLDTQLGAIDTVVDAVLVDTAEIGAAGAGLTALASAANLATLTGYVDTEVGAILAAVDTEVAAIKAKTDNLPAAPAATGDIPSAASIADAVWDEALSGHTTSGTGGAALRDADLRGSRTVVRGTAGTATTPSTTQFTPSALSPAGVAADQFKGRIIVWDNDTATTALRGQVTDITASSAAGLPLLTFTALTTAPSSGDTFSIL